MNAVVQLHVPCAKTEAVARMAALIHASEASVDAASRQTAELFGAVIDERAALGLSASVGAKGEAALARAMTGLADAKVALADAHRTAQTVANAMGIPVVAVGPIDKPGDTPPIGGGGGDGPG